MVYSENTKDISIEELNKINTYSKDVINAIEKQDYSSLETLLSYSDRENKDVMMPILYAVKNKYNTYAIFSILGRNLQENIELALEVIKEEPELIKGTALSNNKDFILNCASINPEVLKYISPELEQDKEFIINLYRKNNKDITRYLQTNNSIDGLIMQDRSLLNDKLFMEAAIISNPEVLKYASVDLKNNKEFIENICRNNNGVIEYIVSHTNEFQKDGLETAKSVLIDVSSTNAISGFEEESKKIRKQIDDENNYNPNSGNLEELLKRDKQLQRHMKLFERIKNGELDAVRAARLINSICKNISPQYKKEIESILKLDEAVLNRQENTQTVAKQNQVQVSLEDIKNVTEGVRLSEIEQATEDTKKLVVNRIERESGINKIFPDTGKK